jgi:hypothetical protein
MRHRYVRLRLLKRASPKDGYWIKQIHISGFPPRHVLSTSTAIDCDSFTASRDTRPPALVPRSECCAV